MVASAPPTPPPGTVIDLKPPLVVAADAGRLAWLRPVSGGRMQLVVRDRGAAARTRGAAFARGDDPGLALGTDAHGHPTAVVSASDRSKRGKRNSLWAVRVAGGSESARRLPASAAVKAGMTAPGLRRGVVSFVERGAGDLDGYATKRLASTTLTSRRVRVVASLGSGYAGLELQSTPLSGRRVLVTQAEPNTTPGAMLVRLRVYGPRGKGRTVVQSRAQTGDGRGDNTGASGLGPLATSADGRTATISRWAAPTDTSTGDPVKGPRDLVTLDLATLRGTARPAPGGADVALGLGAEGFAVFDADRREYNYHARGASNPSGLLRIFRP